MIKKESVNEVNSFLNLHILTQLECMQLSQQMNLLGFPGFAWYYQVQSTDEFLHQRRIINFLQDTIGAEDYKIKCPEFRPFKIKDLCEGIMYYIELRQGTLHQAIELKEKATQRGDLLVAGFYDWFLKDYWTEISENNDLLDRVRMSPNALAGLDRRAGKREELNPNNVIHPMRHFLVDGVDNEETAATFTIAAGKK